MSSARPLKVEPAQAWLGALRAMLKRVPFWLSAPTPLEVRSWLVRPNSCCSALPGSKASALPRPRSASKPATAQSASPAREALPLSAETRPLVGAAPLLPSDPPSAWMGAPVGEEPPQLLRDRQAQIEKLVHDVWPDPGRPEDAQDLAMRIHALGLEDEDVLHRDGVTFHAHDLRDANDFARAVLHAGKLHDHVDGGCHLLPACLHGEIHPRHQHHRLESRQAVAWSVGVDGGEAAVVAGVHRLQHVKGFTAAALANNDSVRPHAQGVDHQLPDPNPALAMDVRRS